MDSLWIEGGARLSGQLEVPASKNASLPLVCLSLLSAKPLHFKNLPEVSDIQSMRALLGSLGVEMSSPAHFQCQELTSIKAHYELVRKMRASILVLGPLLARAGEALVSMPGGCAIGERPVDIHLSGLEKMGAVIKLEEGYVHAKAKRLKGAHIPLRFPSVTGTINLMTAATLAEGETTIENAAREPEVTEVAEALQAMGAQISGAGSSSLRIRGVNELGGFENWEVQPDRIQSLTYLAAAAITFGDLEVRPHRRGCMDAVLSAFQQMGCFVEEGEGKIRLRSENALHPLEIETEAFPGFPTDAQAQFMACLCLAKASDQLSRIRERIFENRFQHVSELRRMGAQIRLRGNLASIKGVDELKGAAVMASDLRASASLVLAGLVAKGKTNVRRIYHLDRGYEALEEKLSSVGAKIWRERAS